MSDSRRESGEGGPKPGDTPFYAEARRLMVERQLRDRGINDARVLEAFRRVPRQAFVPPTYQPMAHEDRPLEIGWGQTISQPYIVAFMVELLRLHPDDRVLDVGTGSGYGAAILSLLTAQVDTIERNENLAATAAYRLKALGYANITVLLGDGTLGCPKRGPYDAILVSAAAPQVPEALKGQLCMGGRLVCPVGTHESQMLARLTRTEDGFRVEEGMRCMFVPLVGKEGWPP